MRSQAFHSCPCSWPAGSRSSVTRPRSCRTAVVVSASPSASSVSRVTCPCVSEYSNVSRPAPVSSAGQVRDHVTETVVGEVGPAPSRSTSATALPRSSYSVDATAPRASTCRVTKAWPHVQPKPRAVVEPAHQLGLVRAARAGRVPDRAQVASLEGRRVGPPRNLELLLDGTAVVAHDSGQQAVGVVVAEARLVKRWLVVAHRAARPVVDTVVGLAGSALAV